MASVYVKSIHEPGVWHMKYIYDETDVARLQSLIGGGVTITFLRGAKPPGPYYAASLKQAVRFVGRWMDSREKWLHGPSMTKHPENAHKPWP